MRYMSPMPARLLITAFTIWALIGSNALALEAGKPMPEIGLQDMQGRAVKVADLRGKVVVVDFWASWCKPCKEELPVLQALYKKYASKGLVVIGVNVERDKDKARKFAKQMGLTFPVVHDGDHSIAERYEPPKMPSSYIVGRGGVVKYVHAGFHAKDAAVIEAQIKKLLAAKP